MMRYQKWLYMAALLICAGCADNHEIVADFCENSVKVSPGVCGCDVLDTDSDGDGTPDCVDLCPEDAAKTAPGVCGCGVDDALDANQNGIVDCIETTIDRCPEDDSKLAPGVCGCGVPDVDLDGDGIYDCQDLCPDNANKQFPGVCGCDVDDVDADNDGVVDCYDECPSDPNKSSAGVCGCLNPETYDDSDGDGVIDCLDGCPHNPHKIDPGPLGCDAEDDDSDGVLNIEDDCPYNPKIQKLAEGQSCNLTQDESGNDVFEIWTSSDFDVLNTLMQQKAEANHNLGLPCHDETVTCQGSTGAVACVNYAVDPEVTDGYEVIYTWQNVDCMDCQTDKTCTDESDESTCVSKDVCMVEVTKASDPCVLCGDALCSEDDPVCRVNPDIATNEPGGSCSTVGKISETDEYVLSCVAEKDNTNSKYAVKQYKTGGNPGDLCENALAYIPTKTADGKRLLCHSGVIVEAVVEGGNDGDPCDSQYYSDTCLEDGTARICLGYIDPNVSGDVTRVGLVKTVPCAYGCQREDASSQRVACIHLQPNQEKRLIVRMMRDVDFSEHTRTVTSTDLSCIGDGPQALLYHVEFDGQGHRLSFRDDGTRCALTRALFSSVVDSDVHDLVLDFDVRGKVSAVFSEIMLNSKIEQISWHGQAYVTDPLLGESPNEMLEDFNMFAPIATIAAYSQISNIDMQGNISVNGKDIDSASSIVMLSNNSVIRNVDLHLSNFIAESTYGFLYTGLHTTLSDIDAEIGKWRAGERVVLISYANSHEYRIHLDVDELSAGEVYFFYAKADSDWQESFDVNVHIQSLEASDVVSFVASWRTHFNRYQLDIDNLKAEVYMNLMAAFDAKFSEVHTHIGHFEESDKSDGVIYPIGQSLQRVVMDTYSFEVDAVSKATEESDLPQLVGGSEIEDSQIDNLTISLPDFDYVVADGETQSKSMVLLAEASSNTKFNHVTYHVGEVKNAKQIALISEATGLQIDDAQVTVGQRSGEDESTSSSEKLGKLENIAAVYALGSQLGASEVDNVIQNSSVRFGDITGAQAIYGGAATYNDAKISNFAVSFQDVDAPDAAVMVYGNVSETVFDNAPVTFGRVNANDIDLFDVTSLMEFKNSAIQFGDITASTFSMGKDVLRETQFESVDINMGAMHIRNDLKITGNTQSCQFTKTHVTTGDIACGGHINDVSLKNTAFDDYALTYGNVTRYAYEGACEATCLETQDCVVNSAGKSQCMDVDNADYVACHDVEGKVFDSAWACVDESLVNFFGIAKSLFNLDEKVKDVSVTTGNITDIDNIYGAIQTFEENVGTPIVEGLRVKLGDIQNADILFGLFEDINAMTLKDAELAIQSSEQTSGTIAAIERISKSTISNMAIDLGPALIAGDFSPINTVDAGSNLSHIDIQLDTIQGAHEVAAFANECIEGVTVQDLKLSANQIIASQFDGIVNTMYCEIDRVDASFQHVEAPIVASMVGDFHNGKIQNASVMMPSVLAENFKAVESPTSGNVTLHNVAHYADVVFAEKPKESSSGFLVANNNVSTNVHNVASMTRMAQGLRNEETHTLDGAWITDVPMILNGNGGTTPTLSNLYWLNRSDVCNKACVAGCDGVDAFEDTDTSIVESALNQQYNTGDRKWITQTLKEYDRDGKAVEVLIPWLEDLQ